MNPICLFLNTKIENTGDLAYLGNLGLAPVRYLLGGKTVRTSYDGALHICHVASFHEKGELNTCKEWSPRPKNPMAKEPWGRPEMRPFTSSSTSLTKTILSILFLVPGLFLSLAKLASYAYEENRKIHQEVQRHFTPVVRTIGTPQKPISSEEEFKKAIQEERTRSKPYHQPTEAIIVYGSNQLTIQKAEDLLFFNPMKIGIFGVPIDRTPFVDIISTLKWTYINEQSPLCDVFSAVQEIKNTYLPLRWSGFCKQWHRLYIYPNVQYPNVQKSS